MFLFCVLSDLMYLCDCIGIRRTVKTGCYVIADSSTYFADAAVYGNIFHFSTAQLEFMSDQYRVYF